MNSIKDLQWNDLISPTMTPKEYMKIFGDKAKKVYESYEPKSKIIEKIRDLLKIE